MIVAVIAALLVGCAADRPAADPGSTTTSAEQPTTSTEQATTSTERPTTTDLPHDQSTTTSTSVDAVQQTQPPPEGTFLSPSGNIFCQMEAGSVLCALSESDIEVPQEVRDQCGTDIGDAILLEVGQPAVLSCHGDPAFLATPGLLGDGVPTLEYGRSVTVTPFTCWSRTSGVRCVDSTTGHSFRISRASYDLN